MCLNKNSRSFSSTASLREFLRKAGSRPLSVKEASVYTGLSQGYIGKLASGGIISRHYYSYFRYYYLRKDLDTYLKSKLRTKQEKYFARLNRKREVIYFYNEPGRR